MSPSNCLRSSRSRSSTSSLSAASMRAWSCLYSRWAGMMPSRRMVPCSVRMFWISEIRLSTSGLCSTRTRCESEYSIVASLRSICSMRCKLLARVGDRKRQRPDRLDDVLQLLGRLVAALVHRVDALVADDPLAPKRQLVDLRVLLVDQADGSCRAAASGSARARSPTCARNFSVTRRAKPRGVLGRAPPDGHLEELRALDDRRLDPVLEVLDRVLRVDRPALLVLGDPTRRLGLDPRVGHHRLEQLGCS
jgi:hypothetical protein